MIVQAEARRLPSDLFVMCGLSWAAALIHVEATFWHAHENALHAVFFALLAAAQLAWGIAVYRAPSPRLLGTGVLLSIAVAAIWGVSRTAGLPGREPVGVADSLATADELVLALLAAARLGGGRRHIAALGMTAAIALISLSSLTFMFSGHGD